MVTSETRTCYRHPSRETGVSCSNCGRPICPDCMTPTPVGMRCPECSRQRTPVRTLRSVTSEPYVTYALIAINVIVFLASGQFTVANNGGGSTILAHGDLYAFAVHNQHEYWRLLTSGFLHLNFLHILFNMYILYVLGIQLEPVLGSRRFALVYFVSLLTGSLGALLLSPDSPTVGASGAIFGIAGAFAVELRARGMNIFAGGLGGIGFFIVANLVLSFSLSGISVGGHIGGLIGGALCALALNQAERRRLPALGVGACAVLAAIAVAASVAVTP